MPPKSKAKDAALGILDIAAPDLDDRLALAMNVGSKLGTRWGLDTAVSIPGFAPQQFRKRIYSTGLLSLDAKLKVGGLPRGTIVELFGPPHAGKSLALYQMIREVQQQCLKCEGTVVYHDRLDAKNKPVIKQVPMLVKGEQQLVDVTVRDSFCKHCDAHNSGGLVILFDQENSFDPVWVTRQGVEITKLVVAKLPTGEHATEMLRTLLLQVKPDFVGIDSIAQLQPKTEQEKSEVDDKTMPGLHARVMARLCRQVTSIFLMDPKNAPLVVWVNQVRADMSGYGKDVVTGGFAPEHYSAVRIKFQPQQLVNQQKPELGRNGKATIKKCKIAEGALNRYVEYIIDDRGFDRAKDIYETAVPLGVWNKTKLQSGQHFWVEDAGFENKLANKKDDMLDLLRTNLDFADEVRRRTFAAMELSAPINMAEGGVYIGDGEAPHDQEPEIGEDAE
jgi:RecA/RadA recombinase